MFNIISREIEWAGSKLKIETGKISRLCDGAVTVTYGETVVLCTVSTDKSPKQGIDFMPLTVHYKEMFFAAGKIPGGFFKREGKASEKEVLVSRLIDRPIRPLFPENFYNETQVICTVLSFDNIHDSDIPAIIGTAAALAISSIPFAGPVAAAKVGYKNGEYILNPKIGDNFPENELDLVVAGTEDSVLMVESEAKMLSEEIMLEAVNFGHKQFQPVIKMIKEIAEEASKQKITIDTKDHSELMNQLRSLIEQDLRQAYSETDKLARYAKIDQAKKKAKEAFESADEIDLSICFKQIQQNIVRRQIVDSGNRIDGRKVDEIRSIECEVSLLPRVHGSALFTRGETQVVVGATLGSGSDEQLIDGLEGESKQHFMLHYNFPPYSVGETSPFRAPGRREIGHGKLAWRAVSQVLPSKTDFPYSIRVVSEVTESNGSSSMATVCGASLSLMDAGVPIKSPVAGIAMGLILESDKYVVLSDILGDEDHLGDMDFKVAGTANGITALQMDIKVKGINSEIMKIALEQAKKGRMHILDKMTMAINGHRVSLNQYAPSMITMKVGKDKIREIIGPGGKIIKSICEESKAKVDIDDNGNITITSLGLENGLIAKKLIEAISMDVEQNQIYNGKIVKLMEFGAFINLLGSKDGFLHISEVTEDKLEKISSVLSEGDQVWVKVIGVDPKGKIKLSMKQVNQENGEDLGSSDDSSNDSAKNFNKPSKKNFKNGNRKESSHNHSERKERFKEGEVKKTRKYFE